MQSSAPVRTAFPSVSIAAALGVALLGAATAAQAAGGPDAYGNTWIESSHPMGPAPEWVSGTQDVFLRVIADIDYVFGDRFEDSLA